MAAKIVAIGMDEVEMLTVLGEALSFAEIDEAGPAGSSPSWITGKVIPLRCMARSLP